MGTNTRIEFEKAKRDIENLKKDLKELVEKYKLEKYEVDSYSVEGYCETICYFTLNGYEWRIETIEEILTEVGVL